MGSLRVLMIGTSLHTMGGIAAVVNQYLGSSLTQKFKIRYLASHCDGNLAQKGFKALWAYYLFFYHLLTLKPDIIHIHGASRASFYRKTPFFLFSKFFGKKIIFHLHGGEFMQFYHNESGQTKKKYIRSVLEMADIIIVLSYKWRDNLNTISDNLNTTILFNSIKISPLKNRIPYKNKIQNVLFLGKIDRNKGIFDIIEAGKSLLKITNQFRFIICGDGNIERCKTLCKEKGVMEYFIFKGWISGKQKTHLLENADIFILPSYNEGMPMSVIEAMSFGLPVIATNVGGIPEIIKHEKTGFLIEPGDVSGLIYYLEKLIKNRELASNIGRSGRQLALEKFDINKSVKKLESIYLSV